MATSFQSADLNDLGLQLQSFLGDCSLRVQCAVRDERLIVLGQHPEETALDAQHVLKLLERKIQSLQINFTHQVRLYLRMGGQSQPYAHRWFMIQPPPPPRRLSLPMQHGQTTTTPTTKNRSDKLLHPPQTGAVAVATRSLAPAAATLTAPPQRSHRKLEKSESTAVAEPELTWFSSSTSVLDLEHPVLDDEMFRAIGLDDRDLPLSSGGDEPKLVTGFVAEEFVAEEKEDLRQDESEAKFASVMESVMGQSVLEIETEPDVTGDGAPAILNSSIAAPDAEEAVWIVGDEELDDLVNQLTTSSSMMIPEAIAPFSDSSGTPSSDTPLTGTPLTGNRQEPNPDAEIAAAATLSFSSDAVSLEPKQDTEASSNPNAADSCGRDPSNQPMNWGHRLISTEERAGSPTVQAGARQEDTSPLLESDLHQKSHIDSVESFGSVESFNLDDDTCDYEALYISEVGELGSSPWPHDADTMQLPAQQMGERVRHLSQLVISPVRSHVDGISQSPLAHINSRRAIAVGVTVMGVTGALYTLTRPCVVGACPQIGSAQELGDKSSKMLQQAEAWKDLERAGTYLNQAVETLEPIPMWSGYASEAKALLGAYGADLLMVETLLDVEDIANTASQTSQDPLYSLADWESVRSLWQQAISQLEAVPSDSPMYAFAREQLRTYRQRIAWVNQQIALEENAKESLNKAKQAAQLAEARQGSAQSLEHWQFARVTWIVALDRLQLVPQDTLAFLEAEPLTQSYQTALDAVTRRVEREQDAQTFLTQAEEQAAMARAAEQRLNWQQAVSDWTEAIASVENIEDGTSPHPEAEDLRTTYNQALSNANEKLLITERIQIELEKTCIGEIRICNLLSVDEVIKIRLDNSYVSAIEAARSSGNNSIQAVVTDHQLILRRALEAIANEYDLPVEVYNPENTMLERHSPRE
ncbi:MAG: hypothetical protein WBA57_08135 [Elainellaceae cyanobacterium]